MTKYGYIDRQNTILRVCLSICKGQEEKEANKNHLLFVFLYREDDLCICVSILHVLHLRPRREEIKRSGDFILDHSILRHLE